MQMLDQTPPSSLEKVSWKEVIQMGEQVSKQATTGLSLSLSLIDSVLQLNSASLSIHCMISMCVLANVKCDFYRNSVAEFP